LSFVVSVLVAALWGCEQLWNCVRFVRNGLVLICPHWADYPLQNKQMLKLAGRLRVEPCSRRGERKAAGVAMARLPLVWDK
jgi:hypothetical protein